MLYCYCYCYCYRYRNSLPLNGFPWMWVARAGFPSPKGFRANPTRFRTA